MDLPQLIVHIEKPVDFNIFDGQWIPYSAKILITGQRAIGKGVAQIYEIEGNNVSLVKEFEAQEGFKCTTFGASPLRQREVAAGMYDGTMQVWDLEKTCYPTYSVKAHEQIINCIDGVGGLSIGYGAPEIVTGSRDGSVKLWDTRLKGAPVTSIEPAVGEDRRDCWAVCFGNSYNNQERAICAGYDNGDVKLFDLRAMRAIWETHLKNGVCGLEFDRKDIEMNKLVVTTLEGQFHVFDMRTYHSKKGYASLKEKIAYRPTVWAVRHLPQNRDLFMICGGKGTVSLWKYRYPSKRFQADSEGEKFGVPGTIELLHEALICVQPISTLQWCRDKLGLGLTTSFDQTFRIIVVTNLNLH